MAEVCPVIRPSPPAPPLVLLVRPGDVRRPVAVSSITPWRLNTFLVCDAWSHDPLCRHTCVWSPRRPGTFFRSMCPQSVRLLTPGRVPDVCDIISDLLRLTVQALVAVGDRLVHSAAVTVSRMSDSSHTQNILDSTGISGVNRLPYVSSSSRSKAVIT